MEALKDIWASLVAGVKDRTTNPLSFAFILSWCLWNYRFFLILAGDGKTSDRLELIDKLYPATRETLYGGALLMPLLTSLAYVFLYPFISSRVITFYRSQQVHIANSIKAVEGQRLLTREDATSLTLRHEAERSKWETKESKLEKQIAELRSALDVAVVEALEGKHSMLGMNKSSTVSSD